MFVGGLVVASVGGVGWVGAQPRPVRPAPPTTRPAPAPRPAPPTRPAPTPVVSSKAAPIKLAGVGALLLTADDERAIAIKQPREVWKAARAAEALQLKRRAEFVAVNPEAKEAEKVTRRPAVVAARFSWVDRGVVTPIKNQNPYGTCWAFSNIAALESAWLLRHHELLDLSEQDLINCNCRKCGASEEGRHGEKLLLGVRREGDNPYKGDGAPELCKTENCGTCDLTTATPFRVEMRVPVNPDHSGDGAQSLEPVPVDQMKQALREHGPLHVKMHIPASSSFGSFSGTGVFEETKQLIQTGPNRNVGAHIVNIVGWDDTQRAWIMKNSWGTNWGNNGYALIRWGSNKIGMGATWFRADAPEHAFTAVWKKATADEVQVYGYTLTAFHDRYNQIKARGYRLHSLRVRPVNGKPLYNAVWRKTFGEDMQVYGRTYADYRKKYDELWKDGWRLAILDNFVENGTVKYSAVWRKTGGAEVQVYDKTYAEFRKQYDALWKDGWRLHLLPNFVHNGVVKYTAVFRQTGGEEVQIYEKSYAEYRKQYDTLWKDGWRLHLIDTVTVAPIAAIGTIGKQVKYTAVWRKTGGDEVQVYGWDYDGFRAKDAELRKAGWSIALVSPI